MPTTILSLPNAPSEILLWVGAGVSFPDPTSLPLGAPLTTFALDQTISSVSRVQLLDRWRRLNAIIDETPHGAPLGIMPRLETVLEAIADAQSSIPGGSFDFLAGFRSFEKATPNQNHDNLALLLKAGASVVTVNFDLCIEDALKNYLPPHGSIRRAKLGTTHRSEVIGAHGYGRIWHLHGIASQPQQLGATIKNIKNGFHAAFTRSLEAQLDRGSHIVFLGYSGSDAFDVTLYFKSFKPSRFHRSSATFVQHGSSRVPDGIRAMLRCFGKATIVNADTHDFIRSLSDSKSAAPASPSYDWEKAFLARAKSSGAGGVTALVSCSICNALGVQVDLVHKGALASAKRFAAGLSLHADEILALAFRLTGQARLEREFTKAPTKLLGYYYANGFVDRAHRLTRPARALLAAAVVAATDLDWSIYTEAAVRCRAIILKHLRTGFASMLTEPEIDELEILLRVFSLLSEKPLAHVRNVQAAAVASRFKMLIHAYLDRVDDLASEQQAATLYGDLGSVSGYVGTYRDIAIKNLVLSPSGRRDSRILDARYFAQKSVSLARCAGDALGERHGLTLIDLMP